MPGPTRLGSSTNLLILQISYSSVSAAAASITGVKNREGILGTDIFCRLGLLTAAAALPEATAWTTVIGFIMAPEPLLGLLFFERACSIVGVMAL